MVPLWPGLLVLLLAALPERFQELLAWERAAIGAGDWWRLWSGHFVHYGWWHAAADGGVLLAVALCAPPVPSGPTAPAALSAPRGAQGTWLAKSPVLAFVVAPLLLSLGLWALLPDMAIYRGASGLAVMCVVAVCVAWLRRGPGRARAWSVACLLALVGKLLLELAGWSAWTVLPAAVAVAWPAHVLGAGLGVVWGIAWGSWVPRAPQGAA